MSFSVVAKGQKKPNKPEAKNANAGAKGKAKEMNTKIDALSTLKVKQNGAELLSYSIADQKNHTGKKFTNEEDKEYTVFVKDINAETVTVSVKGPGVFESKPISRSPTASPAGGAQPSPSTNVLGFEFSLSGPVPVKKATGLM